MRKLFSLLIVLSAAISYAFGQNIKDLEREFTGTWNLVGQAEMNWHSLGKLNFYEVADAIDRRIIDYHIQMTLYFQSGRIELRSDLASSKGRYTMHDENGIVLVEWMNGTPDVYWMFVRGDYLYMIEMGLDSFGEVDGRQNAFKWRLLSK